MTQSIAECNDLLQQAALELRAARDALARLAFVLSELRIAERDQRHARAASDQQTKDAHER